jgi:hypothetical protein
MIVLMRICVYYRYICIYIDTRLRRDMVIPDDCYFYLPNPIKCLYTYYYEYEPIVFFRVSRRERYCRVTDTKIKKIRNEENDRILYVYNECFDFLMIYRFDRIF